MIPLTIRETDRQAQKKDRENRPERRRSLLFCPVFFVPKSLGITAIG